MGNNGSFVMWTLPLSGGWHQAGICAHWL